ncbi:hypothetical protein AB0M87_02545 [Streptomyces sp. NPDC051320]|uniref:hypothetical protein n=1 Tax=Streptomyces sp. NPDC051320 TaxID=3154644 RepID=UPI00341D44BB
MMWLYGVGIWFAAALSVGAFFLAGAWNRDRLARRAAAVEAELLARPTMTYLPRAETRR